MAVRLAGRTARVVGDRGGVSAAEYAILAVGAVVMVGAAVAVLGDPVSGALARAAAALTDQLAALRGQ